MQFNEFAQKLSQVIRAGANTCTFTKTILEAIIIEDGHIKGEEYSNVATPVNETKNEWGDF